MRILICWLLITSATVIAHARTADNMTEPTISVFQGTEKNKSVIVVTWPDGVVDKLVYDNLGPSTSPYAKWFNERYDEYEARKQQNL